MQEEYFGSGALRNVASILEKCDAQKVFLVTGQKSYELSGAQSTLENILLNYELERFSDFSLNPKIEDVQKGISLFRRQNYDAILAVGGGSVLDMAKLINIFVAQSGEPGEYVRGVSDIENKGKPLVAVPTTSGSGSEATQFAVVYLDGLKYSIDHGFVLPNYSIVDPSLTTSLSPRTTAISGIDALGQAIESFWSVNSTELSKQHSRAAIELALQSLEDSVNTSTESSRLNMSKAANLAGKAINIAKTTAPHAISYTLTSYFDIPHGHAVGLNLGKFLTYNGRVTDKDVTDKRGAQYVQEIIQELCGLLGCDTPFAAQTRLDELMDKIGLERDLSRLGVKTSEDHTLILENVNVQRLKNNPRKVSREDLRDLLL